MSPWITEGFRLRFAAIFLNGTQNIFLLSSASISDLLIPVGKFKLSIRGNKRRALVGSLLKQCRNDSFSKFIA